MDEERMQEKAEKIAEEDLDQVSGGAFWYDAIQVMGSIRKKKANEQQVSGEETAVKNELESGAKSKMAQGADEIKKRLDRFARR